MHPGRSLTIGSGVSQELIFLSEEHLALPLLCYSAGTEEVTCDFDEEKDEALRWPLHRNSMLIRPP